MPYLKGDAPSQLDVYVPKITRAYITSRLESGGCCGCWFLLHCWLVGCGVGGVKGWRDSCPQSGVPLQHREPPQPHTNACRCSTHTNTHRNGAAPGPPSPAVQAVVVQGAGEDPLDNEEQLQVGIVRCAALRFARCARCHATS